LDAGIGINLGGDVEEEEEEEEGEDTAISRPESVLKSKYLETPDLIKQSTPTLLPQQTPPQM
jgi:hypothetical protein